MMKTNQFLMSLLLAGGIFTMSGQTTIQNSNLTSFGFGAGTVGNTSTYYGTNAGKLMSTGSSNTFIGFNSGPIATSGTNNTFIGGNTGFNLTSATENVFVGSSAGSRTQTGIQNVYLGNGAGSALSPTYNNGSKNVYIGHNSGFGSTGSNNIFMGNYAGWGSTDSNKLMVDNTSTATPLIWGDFSLDQVKLNGKVGIGGVTTFPTTAGGVSLGTYDLFVKGGILAEEIRVATTWADYVFEDSYALPTLDEVECFIGENGHLPNVPSAKQVAEEGISLGEMAKIQQEKIEELTLYVIQQKKEMEEMKAQIKMLLEQKQ